MALFEEHHEFASIHLPISGMREDLSRQYKLYMQDGRMLEVIAESAADAVAKLDVHEGILRIASVANESKTMLQGNILQSLGTSVETNISFESPFHEVGSLVLDVIEETSEIEPFSLMNLVEYAEAGTKQHEIQAVTVDDQVGVAEDVEITADASNDYEFSNVENVSEAVTDVQSDASVDEDDADPTKGMSEAELAAVAEYLEAANRLNVVEIDVPNETVPVQAQSVAATPEPEEVEDEIELSPEEVRNLLTGGGDRS
jgi:hypothetical protein